MELPVRSKHDQFTRPGGYAELASRVRRQVRGHDVPVLLVYAFDPRTRIGPFVFTDKCLIPGALWAVASALSAAGLTQIRVVLQSWNPKVQPSRARLGGRPPEMLLISAMQIHSAAACALIRDAWKLGRDRPLIVAGGPKATFEPWDLFGLSPDGREGADVVVAGEEYVLLEMLDRILPFKRPADRMGTAFARARRAGALADVPGLIYRPEDTGGDPGSLVHTGPQRLVRDLDELPMPFDAMGLFEPPHRRTTLAPRPLAPDQLHRHATIMTVVPTRGCKFRCAYCPIAAYNQFHHRHKSGQRVREEIAGIAEQTGIRCFFGCDDNFFNDRRVVEEILGAMAQGRAAGEPFRDAIQFATEATEFDVYRHRDLLPLAREAGVRSLYFGIEDLTARLVQKGQSAERTRVVFQSLREHDIAPMPMMMHYDGQPLWSRRGMAGLLNQVNFLRRTGAITCQITLLMPMAGSRSYEQLFRDGRVLSRIGNRPVEDYMYDGNRCICTESPHPWRRQLNILIGYAAFYNPVRLLRALFRFDGLRDVRIFFQLMGIAGLAKSLWVSRADCLRMIHGPIQRHPGPPAPKYPMVDPSPAARPRVVPSRAAVPPRPPRRAAGRTA